MAKSKYGASNFRYTYKPMVSGRTIETDDKQMPHQKSLQSFGPIPAGFVGKVRANERVTPGYTVVSDTQLQKAYAGFWPHFEYKLRMGVWGDKRDIEKQERRRIKNLKSPPKAKSKRGKTKSLTQESLNRGKR